jgi:ABC-type lipoprotein export system ATPase subunit
MITHNPILAAATDRIIEMKDGRAVSQNENSFHLPAVERIN